MKSEYHEINIVAVPFVRVEEINKLFIFCPEEKAKKLFRVPAWIRTSDLQVGRWAIYKLSSPLEVGWRVF